MNIPGIAIDIRWGQLGIDTELPTLELESPPADLAIELPEDILEIEGEMAEIEVDMYPSYYDLGYRKQGDFLRMYVREGREAASEQAARYARQGDRLMDDIRPEAVSEMIADELHEEVPEVNLAWIRGPEFSVRPHELEITPPAGKLAIDTSPGQFSLNLRQGRVSTYLRQKPELTIHPPPRRLDLRA